MASSARLLALGLFVPACFAPNAPADTDIDSTGGVASSGSSAGGSTAPTTGPAEESSSGVTSMSTTGPSDTNPTETTTETTAAETDPTDTASTGTSTADTGTDTADSECGDGVVEGAEVCDDGVNDGSYGGCESDCSALAPYCGDGIEDGGEECDDGDDSQGNGCNNDCIPSGLELWTHEEHQTSSDACVAVVPSGAGHIYIAAQIENLDGGEFAGSFFSQRLSASGGVDWEREHAPLATATTHDYVTFEAADAGDGVLLVGAHRLSATQNPVLTGYTDTHSVKLSAANGDVVWTRSDDGPAFPVGVVADDDGEFAVAALAGTSFDSYLFRVSGAGDAIGSADITAGGSVSAIAFDPAGSFLVAMSPDETVIQRRNAGFGLLWEADMSPLADIVGLATGEGGDIYVAASSWVGRRVSANGSEVWTVSTGDVAALGSPESIAVTPEGDMVVAGRRQGAPWLARLDPTGEVLWSRSAGESGAYASVGVRGDGSVVACGTVDGGGQGDNIFVATYTP